MNHYLEKMMELGADGIDFIPIDSYLINKVGNTNIVASYTRKDFEKREIDTPKTVYLFYKIINGKKEYIY